MSCDTIRKIYRDEKVKYDAGDPTAAYVADKIVAGTGISVAEGTGANENKLVVTNTGVLAEADTLQTVTTRGATTTNGITFNLTAPPVLGAIPVIDLFSGGGTCGATELGVAVGSGFYKGSAAFNNGNVFYNLVSDSTPRSLFGGGYSGEAYRRFRMLSDGQIQWGDGANAQDVILKRNGSLLLNLNSNFEFVKTSPTLILQNGTNTGKSRVFVATAAPDQLYTTANASFDGSNWNRDDTSKSSIVYSLDSGSATTLARFRYGTAAANPITLSTAFQISASGVLQCPKHSPIADSTTAQVFYKADGTTAVMTLDTTNSRVGIGATPIAFFDVYKSANDINNNIVIRNANNGNSAQARLTLFNDNGTTNGTHGASLFLCSSGYASPYTNALGFWNYLNAPIIIATNNTARAMLSATGNLYIGGATNADTILHVKDTQPNITVENSTATASKTYIGTYNVAATAISQFSLNRRPSDGTKYDANRPSVNIALSVSDSAGYIAFETTNTNNGNPVERGRINGLGYFALGQSHTAPITLLHIKGDVASKDTIILESPSASGYASVGLYGAAASQVASFGYGNASAANYKDKVFFNTASKAFSISVNNGTTEHFSMDTSGNVGIGTGATISARLHSLSTTEQLRLSYDALNYLSAIVASTGSTTFGINGTGQVVLTDGAILPVTNNDIDLGSSTYKFKDGYFAGKLTVDGSIDPTDVTFSQIATPSNPASGYNRLYFKSDDKLYKLDATGTEVEVGGGGGSQTPWASDIDGGGYSIANLSAIKDRLTASDWVTGTDYYVGDFVKESGSHYICVQNHLSGDFATDLGNVYWKLTNFLNIDVANRILYEEDTITPFLNWGADGQASGARIYRSTVNQLVFKGVGELYGDTIYVGASDASPDWSISGGNGTLNSYPDLPAVNILNRQLIASDGTTPMIDWSDTTTGVKFGNYGFIETDGGNGLHINTQGTGVLSNYDGLSSFLPSVDWANRILYASDGTTSTLDWTVKNLNYGWTLSDDSTSASIDAGDRKLYASNGDGIRYDWENNLIYDSSVSPGLQSIDPNNRILYASDGTTTVLNYSTQASALTAQETTITHTAPSTADYDMQDFVDVAGDGSQGYSFTDKDEANTLLQVIANLQTRVQELEDRLETYGLLAAN